MRLQIIGDPVLHSKSPVIQGAMLRALDGPLVVGLEAMGRGAAGGGVLPDEGAQRLIGLIAQGAMLRALGLDVPYTPHVVRRGELPQYLAWARENGVAGFNATMPHKEDLLPLLDHIDPAARAIGAVNTVCLRDGRWVGFNTDGAGAVAALKSGLGMEPGVLGAQGLGPLQGAVADKHPLRPGLRQRQGHRLRRAPSPQQGNCEARRLHAQPAFQRRHRPGPVGVEAHPRLRGPALRPRL